MSKRVVYVEGPDCSGKSTLISALKKEGDLIIHNGVYPSPAEAYSAYMDQLIDFRDSKYERLILDRGVLSEVVYGQVMPDHKPSAVDLKLIFDLFDEFNCTVIICLPPFGQCVIPWAKRQHKEYVNQFEQYALIFNMFQQLVNEVPEFDDIIVHDYTKNNQEVINHVNS